MFSLSLQLHDVEFLPVSHPLRTRSIYKKKHLCQGAEFSVFFLLAICTTMLQEIGCQYFFLSSLYNK